MSQLAGSPGMGFWSYSTRLFGHRLEARVGSLQGQRVLVNGAVVSDQPLASIHAPGHFFKLADASGALRNIEIRMVDKSRGLGFKYQMLIRVDGMEVARIDRDREDGRVLCRYCGYGLNELTPENGEIRCPECGRHHAVTE